MVSANWRDLMLFGHIVYMCCKDLENSRFTGPVTTCFLGFLRCMLAN